MATDTGVLQALWSEVRPAVEARDPSLCKPLSRMVNRGKAAEAIARWTEVLEGPPSPTAVVWDRMARDLALHPSDAPRGSDELRNLLWREVLLQKPPALLNCRLLLDEAYLDSVWLRRHGSWIFYRWNGLRFLGTPLDPLLHTVDVGAAAATDYMLQLRVCGTDYPNPKLPPL